MIACVEPLPRLTEMYTEGQLLKFHKKHHAIIKTLTIGKKVLQQNNEMDVRDHHQQNHVDAHACL